MTTATQRAIQAERDDWMAAVDEAAMNAFDMGEQAERIRVIGIVKRWRDGFKGTDYLVRSINLMLAEITKKAPAEAEDVAEIAQAPATVIRVDTSAGERYRLIQALKKAEKETKEIAADIKTALSFCEAGQ